MRCYLQVRVLKKDLGAPLRVRLSAIRSPCGRRAASILRAADGANPFFPKKAVCRVGQHLNIIAYQSLLIIKLSSNHHRMKLLVPAPSRFYYLFAIVCFAFSVQGVFAQRRIANPRVNILDSGIQARMPCGNPSIDTTHQADGGTMYVTECQIDKLLYNVVIVKSLAAVVGTPSEREYRLIFYANQYKSMMDIETCPIFKREQKLANNEAVVGVFYECRGKDGLQFAIQGWQLGQQIVLYSVAGISLPPTEQMEPFFSSVLFK